MKRLILTNIILMMAIFLTTDGRSSSLEMGIPCSDSWYRYIEKNVSTGDFQGHGPDLGSDEWKSVIEFKLGVRGEPNLPDRGSKAWCRHIDKVVGERVASSKNDESSGIEKETTDSSDDCGKAEAASRR